MKFLRRSPLFWIMLVSAAAAIAIGFIAQPAEAESGFWYTHIHGFYAIIGFAGCTGMICIAKLLGRYWLQRREDYYE